MIEITINYYQESILLPEMIKLSPQDYFDDPDELDLDIDSVPRYLDPRDYLAGADSIIKIEIILENPATNKKLALEYNYFDAGKSSISYRTEYDRNRIMYKEQIIDMLIPPSDSDSRTKHDLARFVVENGVYNCIYRAVIADNEDGTEREFKI